MCNKNWKGTEKPSTITDIDSAIKMFDEMYKTRAIRHSVYYIATKLFNEYKQLLGDKK